MGGQGIYTTRRDASLHSRWGLGFPADATLADWRQRAQRALLLHEFLHDWHGDELTAFAKQSLPVGKAAEENALTDAKALRRNHATAYIAIAARVEEELGLHELISNERPGVLGAIDTFPCEEQFLLRSVDAFLAKGEAAKAQELCRPVRAASGWWASPPIPPSRSGGCSGIWPVPRPLLAWPLIRQKPSCPSQRLRWGLVGLPGRCGPPRGWAAASDGAAGGRPECIRR